MVLMPVFEATWKLKKWVWIVSIANPVVCIVPAM